MCFKINGCVQLCKEEKCSFKSSDFLHPHYLPPKKGRRRKRNVGHTDEIHRLLKRPAAVAVSKKMFYFSRDRVCENDPNIWVKPTKYQ